MLEQGLGKGEERAVLGRKGRREEVRGKVGEGCARNKQYNFNESAALTTSVASELGDICHGGVKQNAPAKGKDKTRVSAEGETELSYARELTVVCAEQ